MATKPAALKTPTAVDASRVLFKEFEFAAAPVQPGDLPPDGASPIQVPNDRCIKFTITTSTPDRENDVLETGGIDTTAYAKNGVVQWAHDYKSLPIGRCLGIERFQHKLVATVEFAPADMNPMAEQVFKMVKAGFLNACSIGFRPLEWTYDEARGGMNFQKSEMLEFSVCPIPANAEALVAASKAGIDLSVVKDWAERTLRALPDETATRTADEPVVLILDDAHPIGAQVARAVAADPDVRWNRALSKAFDVTEQEFPPSSLEQDLAAKYCGCPIKDLFHREETVASPRMGAFLVALDETLRSTQVEDIRNISPGGREAPPLYEAIQLNATRREEFLVDGMRFLRVNGVKACVRVEPRWYGLQVTTYAERKQASAARGLLDVTFARAKQLNFLKGEAFTLGGEFLTRGAEDFGDLFLSEANQKAGQRLLQLVNEKGADLDNRGVIMLGPPGNGKTLLGRILMNQAKATFIWCSARDFWYAGGGFNGLAGAFEVARECAPSVLFIEDVDNYLDGHTTDLMKTEMDGIAQSRGVVTILTTNYPELLPKALIDRPGRFHDVLRFDLPDTTARTAMLQKWLPDLTGAAQAETVKALHGYSGAHVRDFARFAGILRDQDGLDVGVAAKAALRKLQEQRDLITSVQTSGSRYRAPEHVVARALRMKTEAEDVGEAGEKGYSPRDVSTTRADEATAWSAPTLSDFTDKAWGDLTAAEKTHIAGHFAYAAEKPPTAYGDLKLPHHRAADGEVVWRGVVGAIARLNQADIPTGDLGPVKAHLRRHYKAFRPDDEVPDAIKASLQPPFDRDEVGWKAFVKARDRAERRAGAPLDDVQLADLLEDYGFDAEAAVLRADAPAMPGGEEVGEEAAELVGYQTLGTLLDQAAQGLAAAQAIVAQLVADETETPTETPDEEVAEEAVEEARLSSIQALAQQAIGALQAVCSLACDLQDDEEDDEAAPLAMPMGAPDLMGRALVRKRGRVLSRRNEETVKTAMAHAQTCAANLQDVLDSIGQEDPADAEADAGEARAIAEAVVLVVDDTEDDVILLAADAPTSPATEVLEVDEAVLGQAVRSVLGEIVTEEIRRAINHARGRVD